MPTGTGKSVVIAMLIERAMAAFPHLRVQVLTHVKELVEQNHAKMLALNPIAPAGIVSAQLGRRDYASQVIFGSIGSVQRNAAKVGHTNLVLVDEAHMVSPKQSTMYRRYFNELLAINPQMRVIGLSATIFRLGLGLLTEGDLFTDVCYDITGMRAFNKLVDEGYLAPLVTKKTELQYDVSDVKTNGGEYNLKQLQSAVDVEELTRAAVREMIAHGNHENRRAWLVFAAGVDHALHTAAIMNEYGIPTGVVHSKLKDEERDEELRKYEMGHYRAMVNNNILTTGFDYPEVDLIGVLRHTKSASLWVQMLGRGTRPCDGKKDCLVLDFADNTLRLGPVNDPVIPKKKGEKKEDAIAPVRLCESCGAYIHASLRECPHCHAEIEFDTTPLLRSSAGVDAVMRRDDKIETATFDVTQVFYTRHPGRGNKPDSVLVTYQCGLYQRYKQWLCFDHPGNARGMAHKWWRQCIKASLHDPDVGVPLAQWADEYPTVDEALELLPQLASPQQIGVWHNKRPYPEVLNCVFEPAAED